MSLKLIKLWLKWRRTACRALKSSTSRARTHRLTLRRRCELVSKKWNCGYFRPLNCELSSNLPQLRTDPERHEVNERNVVAAALGSLSNAAAGQTFHRCGGGRSACVCLSLILFLIMPPKKDADMHSGLTSPNEAPSFPSLASRLLTSPACSPPYSTCVCLSCLCTLLPTEFPVNIRKAVESPCC